jgi:predicted O-methyltransferase YrrM
MPRKTEHWSPHYVLSRALDLFYQRQHPDKPWMTPKAIEMIDRHLTGKEIGLEFGSGRSTAWLSERLGHLTSVEHDPKWFLEIKGRLEKSKVDNIQYVYRSEAEYLEPVFEIGLTSLDFALVDGIRRDECALECLPRMKSKGWLVIDDAHRYLPSKCRAPYARRNKDGAASHFWAQFDELTEDWKHTWTSNGVKATLILVRPD